MIQIYALIDPVTDDIRYIGKGSNPKNRYANHMYKSITGREKSHKANWIRQLHRQGHKPKLAVLEICDEESWVEAERWWIKLYRETTDSLTNIALGGEGASGCVRTAKHRQIISEANKGHTVTEEHKQIIRQRHLGKVQSAETRTKIGSKTSKTYEITTPDGDVFTITNLSRYCRENNLTCSSMNLVASGKLKQHKNYKCRKLFTREHTKSIKTAKPIKKTKKMQDGFMTIQHSTIREDKAIKTVGASAWAVWSVLNSYVNNDKQLAFPSYDKLQELTGMGRSTISKALSTLEEHGMIEKVSKGIHDLAKITNESVDTVVASYLDDLDKRYLSISA